MESKEKENNKLEDQLTLEAIAKGETVITILKGNAPDQPKIYNPNPVSISGTIDAPSRFAEIRDFKQKESHCLVDLSGGNIKLIVNEQETVNKFTIEGKVIIGKLFKELGINKGTTFTPEKLAQKFKLLRNIFENKMEHLGIVKQLRELKATINTEVEKLQDNGGNKVNSLRQTVDSNAPKSFFIKIPMIEGEQPQLIELEVVLEVDNAEVICSLESIDGAEYLEEFTEKAVLAEVEKLKDKTTIIFV